jgi:hypothetical protein
MFRILTLTLLTYFSAATIVSASEKYVHDFYYIENLKISPAGRYIYFAEDRDGAEINLIDTDCIIKIGINECPVKTIEYDNGNLYFDYKFYDNDQFIIFSGNTNSDNKNYKYQLYFEKINISEYIENNFINTKKYRNNIYSNSSAFARFQNLSQKHPIINQILIKSYKVFDDNIKNQKSLNYASIIGYISDNSYLIISRDNNFDMFFSSENISKKIFTKNGHIMLPASFAYGDSSYPQFRLDGKYSYLNVSGSILKIDKNLNYKNISHNQTKAKFINGMNGQYNGYYTIKKSYSENKNLNVIINKKIKDKNIENINYISVNNNSFIIQYQNVFDESDKPYIFKDVKSYYFYLNGKEIHLNKNSKFNFKVNLHFDKLNKIWIKSYSLPQNKSNLLYVHGGPGTSISIDNSNMIKFLLFSGINVDVVEPAGSEYDVDTFNKINTYGYKAFEMDAKGIETFYKSKKVKYTILLESFGGQLLPYFSDTFIEKSNGIILDIPLGTLDLGKVKSRDQVMYNRLSKILGKEVTENNLNNHIFANFKTCPLKVSTVIFFNKDDTQVNPAADYKSCTVSKNVLFIGDSIAHNSAELLPSFREGLNKKWQTISDFAKATNSDLEK